MFAKRIRIECQMGLCVCSILALFVVCVRPCRRYSAESLQCLCIDHSASVHKKITKNIWTKWKIGTISSQKRYFQWMAYLHVINTLANHTRNSEKSIDWFTEHPFTHYHFPSYQWLVWNPFRRRLASDRFSRIVKYSIHLPIYPIPHCEIIKIHSYNSPTMFGVSTLLSSYWAFGKLLCSRNNNTYHTFSPSL